MVKWLSLVLIFLLILSSGCVKSEKTEVCFGEECFRVEVADTSEERERGMMFREHLEKDQGMFFVFDQEGDHAFWMKNTLIPLDIIWINSSQEVVFISRQTPPCNESCPEIKPGRKAKYVLEINGGLSEEMGLEIGDKVRINNL